MSVSTYGALCFTVVMTAVSALGGEPTEILDVAPDGTIGNGACFDADVDASGRFVAFTSQATNLVPGLATPLSRAYVKDRRTGAVTLVSVSSSGEPANFAVYGSRLSADGRCVFFASAASNLVAGDTNQTDDVFRHDLATGATIRVSIGASGAEPNGGTLLGDVSADGSVCVFMSDADTLVAGDTNGFTDVFVRDIAAGVTERVDVATDGTQSDEWSGEPDLSSDGSRVVFMSTATNLVAGDTNATTDVFVHDRTTGSTTRVSVDAMGLELAASSGGPAISGDGRTVMFLSVSNGLVPGDTNGIFDWFTRDLVTGKIARVSVASTGAEAQLSQFFGNTFTSRALSEDGRFAAFSSPIAGFVPDDSNAASDVFIHDGASKSTTRVSVNSMGEQTVTHAPWTDVPWSWLGGMSASGRFVAFLSRATNLISGPQPSQHGVVHAYLRDRGTWTDLNGPLGGPAGAPLLVLSGTVSANDHGVLTLAGAPPGAVVAVFAATRSSPIPYFGGTLQAHPADQIRITSADAAGHLVHFYAIPQQAPSGLEVFVQCAMPDLAAPFGVALSNCVHGVSP